ncbi:hypothetical protein GCM10027073_65840 [Streptomyces chlorus]
MSNRSCRWGCERWREQWCHRDGTVRSEALYGTMGRMGDNRIVNTHQAEAWNGYEGRHWADHQARYDALNDPANTPLLNAARLQDTDGVLGIG